MSLIDDLRGLDVSGVISARGALTSAVNVPDIASITSKGGATAALGGLGQSLTDLQSNFPNSESMLRASLQVFEKLAPKLDTSHLPLAQYVTVVREGAAIASKVLTTFSDHPGDWGSGLGRSIGDALQLVGGKAGELGGNLGRAADAYPELLHLVDHPPSDPRALGRLAVELILPFPHESLVSLRDGARLLTEGAGRIALPAGRTSGLIAAFDVVATAAATGDDARLEAALRELDRARRQTLATLDDDLRFAAEQLARLKIPQVLNPLAGVSNALKMGRGGVIDFMSDVRREMGEIRFQIENLDIERVRTFLREIPDLVEKKARDGIEKPVDEMVESAKDGLREIFRRLPVRQYRAEVGRFLHEIAVRIDEANIDGPANEARNALHQASSFLTDNGLAGQVQAELQRLNQSIGGVLDGIEAPLTQIATEVDAVANQAVAILDRVADALLQFQSAIDQLQKAIEDLGIHETEQQIVEALRNLRQKAEDLLSNVPLPEQLRPPVEQLVSELSHLDFDALLAPVRDVAAQMKIPDDVNDLVRNGLDEVRKVVQNLIPQQLIDSISSEIEKALDSVRSFNPASLLPDLSSQLNEAAAAIEKLDPRAIAEDIRGPFQAVLDIIDRVHPLILLKPVIEAYDSLMNAVPTPSAQPAAQSMTQAMDSAGRVAGRALLEPAARLTPDSKPEVGDPDHSRPVETPADPSTVKPGDAIRLLGYVPGKLREALHAIEASAAGDVLNEIDSLCAGLARQLRAVPDAIAAIERRIDSDLRALFIPVSAAQARAQLAIHARVSTGSLDLHLDAVAVAGPGNLQKELMQTMGGVRQQIRGSLNLASGSVRQSFERAAVALESSSLAAITGDLDALLAALDPEPIASEMDLIMSTILQKTPALLQGIGADLRAALLRLRAIVNELNPMALAQRFLAVLDVLKEELDVLNPRRLATELAEIHRAIRQSIEAYDPRLLAADLADISKAVATQIRALNPQQLLGDLNFWQATVDRLEQLNPAVRLQAVGAALQPVGERLAAINLDGLIDAVNQLPPLIVDDFEALIEAIRNEIVALLESLKFATGNASATASVSLA